MTVDAFDGLITQFNPTRLQIPWKHLPETDGRYSVAISLNAGSSYDPSTPLIAQVEAVSEVWWLTMYMSQNFWKARPEPPTGVDIVLDVHVSGPDGVEIATEQYRPKFNETKKDSWRVRFVSNIFRVNTDFF